MQVQVPARCRATTPGHHTARHPPHTPPMARPQRQQSHRRQQQQQWVRSAGQEAVTTTTAPPAAAAAPAPATEPTPSQPPQTEQQQQQQQQAGGPEARHPEGWQQCTQLVQDLGFTDTQAAQFVQRAFGWGPKARAYWRHEKSEAAPDLQQLVAVLDYLRSELGMDDAQVAATVKAFPEVLGCAVAPQLAGNVAQLRSQWRLEGPVLLKAVLRNPALLGYNVDCMGDCAGECNRCWARF